MKTALERSEKRTPQPRRHANDQRPGLQAPGTLGRQQDILSRRIATGPVMTAQRRKLDQLTTEEPVQRQSGPEEEELLQGKFIAQHQTEEEEELMQGAFTATGPLGANSKAR